MFNINKSFIAGLIGVVALNVGFMGSVDTAAANQTIRVGSTEIEVVLPDVEPPAPKSLDEGVMARVQAVRAKKADIEAANPHGPSERFLEIEAKNKAWLEDIRQKNEAEFEAIKSDYKAKYMEAESHLTDPANFPKKNKIQ